MNPFIMQLGAYWLALTRHGKIFHRQLDKFLELQTFKESDFSDWRLDQYEKIAHLAQTKTHFYRQLTDHEILVTNKADVRSRGELFLTRHRLDPRVRVMATSGTTGVGLRIYTDNVHIASVAASWWAFRANFDVKYGEKGVVFGGRKISSSDSREAFPWIFLKPMNQILASTYHIAKNTIPHYLNMLEKEKVVWIHGYPSALVPIARYIVEHDIDLQVRPKLVSTGSETISNESRALLSTAFKCHISEYYSQVEGVCSIWRCAHGTLHDQGILGELVLDDFKGTGASEIVGSGYWNYTMPLLSYRTGDLLVSAKRTCKCGHPFALGNEIEGRIDDYVVSRDGRKVGRLARLFTHVKGGEEAQLIQIGLGKFKLLLPPNGSVAQRKFKSNLEELLDEKIILQIEFVEQFKRTRNGKLKTVIRSF
jgi:phenylacetate-CoA ligase